MLHKYVYIDIYIYIYMYIYINIMYILILLVLLIASPWPCGHPSRLQLAGEWLQIAGEVSSILRLHECRLVYKHSCVLLNL